MVKTISDWYTFSDGHKVYEKTWQPEIEPRVQLVFIHGFSDRIDHYDAFFDILVSQYPIKVTAWDRRGWGKSVHQPSQRGNTGPMLQQMNETNEYLNHVTSKIPDLKATPVFLMGHSMGGQETAYYMLNQLSFQNDARSKIAGIILDGPYIGLDAATQPSSLKVAAGKVVALLLPHFQLCEPVRVEYISPDPEVQKMYKDDPLCPGLGTLECFRDMLQRSAELTALAEKPKAPSKTLKTKLPCPILWTHGTADRACDFSTSKKLFERLEASDNEQDSKIFKAYEGWSHQLHNEPKGCKEQYAKDVGDWVLKIVEKPS